MKLSVAAYRAITDTTNKRLTREWQRGSHAYGSVNGGSPSHSLSIEDTADKTPEIKSAFDGQCDQVNVSTGSSSNRRKSSAAAVLPPSIPPPTVTNHQQQQPASSASSSNERRGTKATPKVPSKKEVKKFMSNQRSRGTQRWMKLRTTVQLTGAVTSAVRDKKPPLKREDSFLKRFSTRHTAEIVATDYDDVEDEEEDDGDDDLRSDVEAQKDLSYQPQVHTPQQLRRRQRRRLRRERRWVINPDENVYFWWLSVITFCVLYNYWTLIVRQAFPELQRTPSTALWHFADGLTDFVFLLDIAAQFRTGYLEQGLMVYDSRKLAKHYVRSRAFALDLFTLLPLDLFRLLFSRPSPLFRFPRFIKVYRSYHYYYMVESRTLYPNLWRVVNLVHILLLLAHWFGCFYYLLSEAENFIGEWVYPCPVDDFAHLTRKYLASLYWSTLTLTTIGDLPTPESDIQYLFTIVSYLCGVFVFATIVGQVGNVITNRNANRLEFERLLDGAKLYMRHHKVPREMQRRVQRWYDYTWSRGRMHAGGDINTALGILPDKLKTELALHVNLNTLKKVTIFQECQPEFLHDLVLKMKAYIFTPGDVICRKGEVAREMFIIADGILEVISSENGKVLTTMKSGDFFGEIGILNLDGLNRRTADVRSVGYAELFSLSREDVLGAMKDYPEAQDILQSMGKKRLMEARKAAADCKKETEEKNQRLSAAAENEAGEAAVGDKDAEKDEGEGEGSSSESESTRQKAVQMVRRLKRDAKDFKNYLVRSSSKSFSGPRNSSDEVRIEMEAVNSARSTPKRRLTVASGENIPQLDPKHPFLPRTPKIQPPPSSSVISIAETVSVKPPQTFLQRVLALKNMNVAECATVPPPTATSPNASASGPAEQAETKKADVKASEEKKVVDGNVEAWGATVELIRPNESKPSAQPSPEVNPKGNGHVIKSILKHFSNSESDVSDLLMMEQEDKMSLTPCNSEKRKLTKTVSFRDHYLKSPPHSQEITYKPEECIADLLVGIKQILQIRLQDDIQDQFRSRLVALETAMQNKDEIMRHIENKIKLLETDSQTRVVLDENQFNNESSNFQTNEPPEHEPLNREDQGESSLTHPGYIAHPRRSWPMLPSRQKLLRQKSFEDVSQSDVFWKDETSTMTSSDGGNSDPDTDQTLKDADDLTDLEDITQTIDEEDEEEDEDEDEEEEDEDEITEEQEVIKVNTRPVMEGGGSGGSSGGGGANWEIQMLAKEMLKKELISKLSNVEEEAEDEEDDCGSASGDPSAIFRVPEQNPMGENQIIQQFVQNTLKRLEKLEKVFTKKPGLVRQRSLQEHGSPGKLRQRLQRQTSCGTEDLPSSTNNNYSNTSSSSNQSNQSLVATPSVSMIPLSGLKMNDHETGTLPTPFFSPPTDEEDLILAPELLVNNVDTQPLIKPK